MLKNFLVRVNCTESGRERYLRVTACRYIMSQPVSFHGEFSCCFQCSGMRATLSLHTPWVSLACFTTEKVQLPLRDPIFIERKKDRHGDEPVYKGKKTCTGVSRFFPWKKTPERGQWQDFSEEKKTEHGGELVFSEKKKPDTNGEPDFSMEKRATRREQIFRGKKTRHRRGAGFFRNSGGGATDFPIPALERAEARRERKVASPIRTETNEAAAAPMGNRT